VVHIWVEERGRHFTDDEEIEMAVWKWLRQHTKDSYGADFDDCKAMGQVYLCWWRLCQEINVFPGSNITYFRFHIHL
jgi:hypothetical protein